MYPQTISRWVGGDSPKRGTHWLETESGREGTCVDQVPVDKNGWDSTVSQLGPTTLSVWTGKTWQSDSTITIKCVDPAYRSH